METIVSCARFVACQHIMRLFSFSKMTNSSSNVRCCWCWCLKGWGWCCCLFTICGWDLGRDGGGRWQIGTALSIWLVGRALAVTGLETDSFFSRSSLISVFFGSSLSLTECNLFKVISSLMLLLMLLLWLFYFHQSEASVSSRPIAPLSTPARWWRRLSLFPSIKGTFNATSISANKIWLGPTVPTIPR